MNIEQWPIDRPKPYEKNARKIPQSAIDKVAKSLSEFGWQQPIVVDKGGVVIVGHVRLRASKKLKLKTVPVHVATDLTPEQVKAYRLMDNRSHEDAMWDIGLLGAELADMKSSGLSLELSGFESNELDALLDTVAHDVLFKQYDKNVADSVEWIECPECHHKWAK